MLPRFAEVNTANQKVPVARSVLPHLKETAVADHGYPSALLGLPYLVEVAVTNRKDPEAQHALPHREEAVVADCGGLAAQLGFF